MMDLEELKSVWASVDERLGKEKLLKESIIREMIRSKSDKSLRKLMNYEVLSLVVCLFSIPVMVALLYVNYFREQTQWGGKVFVWTVVVICTAAVIWQLIKITQLMKVDFTKNIRSNSLIMNRYNLCIRKEKMVGIFVTAVLYCEGIWMYALLHANAFLWTFLTCMLLFGILLSLYIWRVFDQNINSIRQSLEELKELEEKQE